MTKKTKKNLPKVEIEFSASGSIRQTLQLLDPKLTAEAFVEGLNDGTYQTTVQEGGAADETATGRPVAQVVNTDNSLNYEAFDLRTTEEPLDKVELLHLIARHIRGDSAPDDADFPDQRIKAVTVDNDHKSGELIVTTHDGRQLVLRAADIEEQA